MYIYICIYIYIYICIYKPPRPSRPKPCANPGLVDDYSQKGSQPGAQFIQVIKGSSPGLMVWELLHRPSY